VGSYSRALIWLGIVALLGSCNAAAPSVVPTELGFAHGQLVQVRMNPQTSVDPGLKSASFKSPAMVAKTTSSLRPTRSSSDVGDQYLYINALDFSTAAPHHRVFPFQDVLKLAPVAGVSLESVAHCTFDLQLDSEPNPCTIAFDWSDAPPANGTFVGLSNWTTGTWEWFSADVDGVITLPGWTDYKDADGRVLISLLVTGTKRGMLRGVKLGKDEERGTGVEPIETDDEETEDGPEDPALPAPPLYQPEMPAALDLSAECGRVRDQGWWQSCTAFAFGDGAYSMILSELYGRLGWDVDSGSFALAPKYLYVSSGRRSGCPDDPTCLRGPGQVADSLRLDGIALEQNAPYDYSYNASWSPAAVEDAKRLRIDTVTQVQCYWDAGRTAIKGILYSARRPLVIAINIDQGYTHYVPGTVYTYSGPPIGAHEMCIVGYDDNLQAYKVRNSWGTGWGVDGYAWVSYETFDNSESNPSCYLIDDAYDPAVASRFLPFGEGIAAPAALTAADGQSADGVPLSWQAVPGAAGYRVYRDTPDNLIADVPTSAFVDSTALEGYSHLYWVSSYDPFTESAHSAVDLGFRLYTQ
jgi:hypothetical protein